MGEALEVVIDDPADIALGEWETFQRDAGHTGYVPATFQPRSFAYKWEWFDKDGNLILQIFPYRKDTPPDAWNAMAAALPGVSA